MLCMVMLSQMLICKALLSYVIFGMVVVLLIQALFLNGNFFLALSSSLE